MKAIHLSFKVL